MNRSCRPSAAAALLLIALFHCGAQSSVAPSGPPRAAISFDFTRAGVPVPRYTLDVAEDGSGSYAAQVSSSTTPQQIHADFKLTAGTTKKMFSHARAIHPEVCASKAKNIADTGTKVLTYTTSGATSACTYNYSENKDIAALTEIFQGLAETLDMGRRLDFLRRFDRLGLDEAIASLTEETSSGRAFELGTIEPSLRALASDPQVMERVRAKAATLLATIPADSSSR